jgi:hypothetical protein
VWHFVLHCSFVVAMLLAFEGVLIDSRRRLWQSLNDLTSGRNGSKSGPKTQAGKQRSRLNRVTHGLTSTTLVVSPYEHEYQELLRGFREPSNRRTRPKMRSCHLAQTHWRSLRISSLGDRHNNITAATERSTARLWRRNRWPLYAEIINRSWPGHSPEAIDFATLERADGVNDRQFVGPLATSLRLKRSNVTTPGWNRQLWWRNST